MAWLAAVAEVEQQLIQQQIEVTLGPKLSVRLLPSSHPPSPCTFAERRDR